VQPTQFQPLLQRLPINRLCQRISTRKEPIARIIHTLHAASASVWPVSHAGNPPCFFYPEWFNSLHIVRRKKTKCPGEQPVCSHCARLHQTCTYISSRRVSQRVSRSPAIDALSESSTDGRQGVVCSSFLEFGILLSFWASGTSSRTLGGSDDSRFT